MSNICTVLTVSTMHLRLASSIHFFCLPSFTLLNDRCVYRGPHQLQCSLVSSVRPLPRAHSLYFEHLSSCFPVRKFRRLRRRVSSACKIHERLLTFSRDRKHSTAVHGSTHHLLCPICRRWSPSTNRPFNLTIVAKQIIFISKTFLFCLPNKHRTSIQNVLVEFWHYHV